MLRKWRGHNRVEEKQDRTREGERKAKRSASREFGKTSEVRNE